MFGIQAMSSQLGKGFHQSGGEVRVLQGQATELGSYMTALLSIFLSSAGQVFFKLTMRGNKAISLSLLHSPYLYIGFASYGLSAVLWLSVLSKLPLVIAYPLTALNFVLIALAGRLLLHEPLPWTWGVGAAFIMIGVVVVARGQG